MWLRITAFLSLSFPFPLSLSFRSSFFQSVGLSVGLCQSLLAAAVCVCVCVCVRACVYMIFFFKNSSPTVFISLSPCPLQLMSPLSHLSPSRCQSVYFDPSIYLFISICFGSFFFFLSEVVCRCVSRAQTHTYTHQHAFLLWAPWGHVSGTRGERTNRSNFSGMQKLTQTRAHKDRSMIKLANTHTRAF